MNTITTFARTPGAKDKEPRNRRRRNLLLAGVGTALLAGGGLYAAKRFGGKSVSKAASSTIKKTSSVTDDVKTTPFTVSTPKPNNVDLDVKREQIRNAANKLQNEADELRTKETNLRNQYSIKKKQSNTERVKRRKELLDKDGVLSKIIGYNTFVKNKTKAGRRPSVDNYRSSRNEIKADIDRVKRNTLNYHLLITLNHF